MPARVAVADVPGVNAFSLVTSAQSFVPSPEAEALVTKQRKLIRKTYGAKGRQILRDAQAYADGVNAYLKSIGTPAEPPANVNDVIAVTAFIGSIFGAGGGGEATNSELLGKLQQGLGKVRGHKAWDDVLLAEDPEAPTTIRNRFDYPVKTGGKVTGSLTIDPGSIEAFDPRAAAGPAAVNAAAAPPGRQASNFQVVAPFRSASGNSLAVMGPQLGYYYPEIVAADRPARTGNARSGRGRARPRHVHPHRPDEELRVEPHLGQSRRPRRVRGEALQPRRLDAHAGVHPLPVQGQVPRPAQLRRRTARGQAVALQDVGARAGDRDRHGGREALRAVAPPLHLRAGRPQPGRAARSDRRQGDHAQALLPARPTSSASRSTGPTSPGSPPPSSPPGSFRFVRAVSTAGWDARHGQVRVERLSCGSDSTRTS